MQGTTVAGLIAALLFAPNTSHGQAEFEVASVKRLASQGEVQFPGCVGGRFILSGLPLIYVLEWAYDATGNEISGAPGWLNSPDSLYQIDAKSENNVTEVQCQRMVQALLGDRFHLKFHQETKEVAAYDLVIDKNGPRIRPAPAEGPGVTINGFGGIWEGLPRMSCLSPQPMCTHPPKGVSMGFLASLLERIPAVGEPVVDKTGLQGSYEFNFDYARRPGEDRPDPFAAVQDQLGLKLESSKTLKTFLVIESIERPTEN